MKKIQIGWRWALLPLFILIAAAFLWLFSAYMHTAGRPLYLTPVFEDDKGWDIYTLEGGARTDLTPRELMEVEQDETFYLSRLLTDDWETAEYTFMCLDSNRPCSVFLDNELLYTTCPDVEQRVGQIRFPADYEGLPQGMESIRISLPRGITGQELTIATAHHSEYGSSMPGILLSAEAVNAEHWMETANRSTMPAAAFAVGALVLLGRFFYSLFMGGRDWPLLLLAATAMVQLFYHLREYSFASPGFTPLDTPWAAFLPHLMVLLPALFMVLQMKNRRRLCTIAVAVTAAISLIPPITNLFGPPQFDTINFIRAFYIGIIALLLFAALEAVIKNSIFRVFWICFGAVAGCLIIFLLILSLEAGSLPAVVSPILSIIRLQGPFILLPWIGTLLFIVNAVFSVYVVIRHTADTQTELALQLERSDRLDYELSVQKQTYEAKLTAEEDLRAMRHDMKGHLSALSALISEGSTGEAAAYLERLTGWNQERQPAAFCQNPYMNAVLSSYAMRFREHGIPFIFRVGADGQSLPTVELCLILNNALDNALEASLRQPEKDRSVEVKTRVRNGQFLLRVSNRFTGTADEKGDLPATTKTEKGHGYGMGSIRSTARRLGGDMYYRVEQGSFLLDVHFPLPEEDD